MQVDVKNQRGETTQSIELDDAVFNVPMNRTLVHQAMVIYEGNKRQGTSDTKTRGRVSGGGRKPWIQKHTGRARQGSTRSPQWRHGGVVFGPHPRSYRKSLPRRMRRLALRCVLSDKLRQDRLVCLDGTDTINGKTKSIAELLQNLAITGSALVVTKESDQNVVWAASNLKKIWTLPVNQLNAAELLSRETVIITVEAAQWAADSLANEPHGRRGRGPVAAANGAPATVKEETKVAPAPTRRRRATAATDEAAAPEAGEAAAEASPPARRRRRTTVSAPDEAGAEASQVGEPSEIAETSGAEGLVADESGEEN
jgi:large subunit ribosomal protein L4